MALDTDAQFIGERLIGGSPPSVFRLSAAGRRRVNAAISGPAPASPLIDQLTAAGVLHPVVHPVAATDVSSRVTVVVPTLGMPKHVPVVPEGVRVVIVDDHSNPPVPHATLRRTSRGGPAAARASGLGAVDTELVAFVDADVDTTTTPDWLQLCVAHIDAGADIVAPRVRENPAAPLRRRSGPLDMGHRPGPVGHGRRVSYVPSAVMVCKVAALTDVGGFDERMLTGEDVDLVWRVVDAGRRVRYAPEIVVAHERRLHLVDRLRREYDYGLSAGPLAARHPRRLHPLVASPWAAAIIVVAALPLTRPVRGAIMALVCAAATRRLAAGTGLGRADAAAVVARSVATTAVALARAVRMLWWPACLVGVRHRGPRRLLLAALLTAGSGERVACDIAHGLGVWRSVIDSRSTDPVTPRLLWRHRDTATAPYAAGS